MRKHREMLFWLLLLGSWQLLASERDIEGIVGAIGAGAFLLFAGKSLGKLKHVGMNFARWEPTSRPKWIMAVAYGIAAGIAVFAIASVVGQDIVLGDDWELILLHLTLGPVLEELIFRGYAFALFRWLLSGALKRVPADWTVILTAAAVFALVHLAQPGVGWLQLACVAGTGTLYGCLRSRSGSAALSAASHASYNLTLYVAAGAMAVVRYLLS